MSSCRFIDDKLAEGKIVLLDGATGTELEKRGVPMHGKAWSAAAIVTHPDIVRAVHVDYIKAGVDVITINSFSLAKHMLVSAGMQDEFRRLNRKAVTLAREAREEAASAPVAIAGSLAPTTFCSDPLKCYPPEAQAYSWYKEQADIQAEAGVDLLIVEMIEELVTGRAAVAAAVATGLPVWLGFSCSRTAGGKIMLWEQGHSLQEGIVEVGQLGGSVALIMHTDVGDVSEALTILANNCSKQLGVYAHSGTFLMPNWKFNNIISPQDYARAAEQWLAIGAKIIGGCCGVGPDHIRALKERFC
jgi:S-methylmethionine-dependent homocysteine/selenocysteine methylase